MLKSTDWFEYIHEKYNCAFIWQQTLIIASTGVALIISAKVGCSSLGKISVKTGNTCVFIETLKCIIKSSHLCINIRNDY